MYIESSSPRKVNDTAILVSPLITSSATCTMRFFYHMRGAHIGTLNVYKRVGNVKSLLWSLTGDQGEKWLKNTVSLTASNGFYVSVLPSFLPSFLPSLLHFLPSFPSFISFLPSFFPSFLPYTMYIF